MLCQNKYHYGYTVIYSKTIFTKIKSKKVTKYTFGFQIWQFKRFHFRYKHMDMKALNLKVELYQLAKFQEASQSPHRYQFKRNA